MGGGGGVALDSTWGPANIDKKQYPVRFQEGRTMSEDLVMIIIWLLLWLNTAVNLERALKWKVQ